MPSADGVRETYFKTPVDGQVFASGATIEITAHTSSDIARMLAWYDGWSWIGDDTQAPFSVSVSGLLTVCTS